jgi:hypothetical protein
MAYYGALAQAHKSCYVEAMKTKYVKPDEVKAPRERWALIKVLSDEGAGGPAVALGHWDRKVVLAMRWNGDGEKPNGNPQSRGLPTWFIVPSAYVQVILSRLPEDKLELVRNFLPVEAQHYVTRIK